jgi:hypothetical protein
MPESPTKETDWAVCCRANPSTKDKVEQPFQEHSRYIFTGKCKEPKSGNKGREVESGWKHVTTARGWWRRGDVSACAVHANMECWAHHNINLDLDTVNQHLRDAWEQENDQDDVKMDLQGLERQCWLGTEADA